MPPDISVVIPLSNQPRYLQLLPEALESISQQTISPYETIIVCDGEVPLTAGMASYADRIVNIPCRVGVPSAFNIGIASASSPLVLMMGCDDLLRPQCIESILDTFEKRGKQDALYWLDVEFEDGTRQCLPCGAAATTKEFWRWVGGYPLQTAQGACDSALVSILLKNAPHKLIEVATRTPQYIVRRDITSYTGSSSPQWQGVIMETRGILTETWKPNE